MSTSNSKTARIISEGELKKVKYKILYGAMFVILLIVSICCLLPSIWVFISGFKTSNEIYSVPTVFFPKQFHLSSIIDAWKSLGFSKNILSTFIVAFGNIICMLVVCGLGGYVLSRLKPKGHKVIFMLVMWSMMLPYQMRTVPLFMSFIEFPVIKVNLLDTYVPLFLIAAANSFNILLFKNFFDSISISLIESACIDGCTNLKIFFKIILPLSVPVIAYTAICDFNGAWSNFFWPMLVLNDEALQTMPVRILKISGSSEVKANTYMMALTFACIPPLVMFAFFQKFMIGGINVGGVKG